MTVCFFFFFFFFSRIPIQHTAAAAAAAAPMAAHGLPHLFPPPSHLGFPPLHSSPLFFLALHSLWDAFLPFVLLWCNLMLCATCAKYFSWRRFRPSSPPLRLHSPPFLAASDTPADPDHFSLSDHDGAGLGLANGCQHLNVGYSPLVPNTRLDDVRYQMHDQVWVEPYTADEDLSPSPMYQDSPLSRDVAPGSSTAVVQAKHAYRFLEGATAERCKRTYYSELGIEAEKSEYTADVSKIHESGRGSRPGPSEGRVIKSKEPSYSGISVGRVIKSKEPSRSGISVADDDIGRINPSSKISSLRIYSQGDSNIVTLCLPSISSCEKLSPLFLNGEESISSSLCVSESDALPLTDRMFQKRSFSLNALVCSTSNGPRLQVERPAFHYNYNPLRDNWISLGLFYRNETRFLQMFTGCSRSSHALMDTMKRMPSLEWTLETLKAWMLGTRTSDEAGFWLHMIKTNLTNCAATDITNISAINLGYLKCLSELNRSSNSGKNVYLCGPRDVATNRSTGEEQGDLSHKQVVPAVEEEVEAKAEPEEEQQHQEEDGEEIHNNKGDDFWNNNYLSNKYYGLYAGQNEFDDGDDRMPGDGCFLFGVGPIGGDSFHNSQDDEQSYRREIDSIFHNVNECFVEEEDDDTFNCVRHGDDCDVGAYNDQALDTWWDHDAVFIEQASDKMDQTWFII